MYCQCGTEITISSRWNGLVHQTVFESDGDEINECPGCEESASAWLIIGEEQLIYREGSLSDYPEMPK